MQLHTHDTTELQTRRPKKWTLERDPQQRRIRIWRKWTRQPWRRNLRSAPLSRKRSFDLDHFASFRRSLLQVRGLNEFFCSFIEANSAFFHNPVSAILTDLRSQTWILGDHSCYRFQRYLSRRSCSVFFALLAKFVESHDFEERDKRFCELCYVPLRNQDSGS